MKPILIVVDMQKDFVDGALGTIEAQAIVPAVVNRIKDAKSQNWDVVFTLDTHGADYLQSSEGKNLPVEHCIKGREGWKLNDAIACEAEGCKRFEKPTFGSTALIDELLGKGLPADAQFELCGVCTDICVISNALLIKAYFPEAQITVDSALCAGVTPQKHEAALEAMRSCQIHVL